MKKVLALILIGIIGIGIGYFYFSKEEPKEVEIVEKEEKEEPKLQDTDVASSIFKNSYHKAIETVSQMTTEEKVGQLFLVRYDNTVTNQQKDYYPGGYLLFAKDFENHTKESIKQELARVNEINKYPLVFAVDEEGGYVTRVSRFKAFRSEKFASPRYYYEQGGYEQLEQTETEKATLLKEIGINLNLAPVADVSTDPNDFINNRTFGVNAEETAKLIEKMVTYANQNKINSCLKHFPGYGNNEDTHTGIAVDNRSYENFVQNDFLPFQAGITANVPCVLVSHNIINVMDSEYPASISPKVIHELRETLGFTGIVITDDLAMDAMGSYVEQQTAATLAINAGNDMIITSDFIPMYEEVLTSLKENKITEDTLNKAVIRIIAWKYESGLF